MAYIPRPVASAGGRGVSAVRPHSISLSTRGTVIAPFIIKQTAIVCVDLLAHQEGRIMNKATSTLIAAVAALALSGGAYAQSAGGSNGSGSAGSTASPSNQMNNNAAGGYGMPGNTNSDSGMANRSPNSGLPSSTSGNTTSGSSAPKTHNTLATPSVVSPAAGQ